MIRKYLLIIVLAVSTITAFAAVNATAEESDETQETVVADNASQATNKTDNTSGASTNAIIEDAVDDIFKITLADAFKLYYTNEFAKATEFFELAFDQSNDDKVKLQMASYSALSYRGLKNYEKSNKWFQIAYRFAVRSNNIESVATILAQIAENYKLLSKYSDALKFYEQAIMKDDLDNRTKATLLYGLAVTYVSDNLSEKAVSACSEAQIFAEAEKLELITLNCDLIKAEKLRADEDYATSMQIFKATYDKSVARAYPNIKINSLIGLAKISEKLSRYSVARNRYEEALFSSISNSIYDDIALISERASELLFFTEVKEKQTADKIYRASSDIDNATYISLKNRVEILSSDYYTTISQTGKALSILKPLYVNAVKMQDNLTATLALYSTARAYYTIKNYATALLQIEEALVRVKNIKYSETDKLYAMKAKIIYDLRMVSEAEKFIRIAIETSKDELSVERYKDLLQTIDMRKNMDRQLYMTERPAVDIDNITIDKGKDAEEEDIFTINEMITSDDPDIAIDDEEVISNDNVTQDLDIIDLSETDDNSSMDEIIVIDNSSSQDNKTAGKKDNSTKK